MTPPASTTKSTRVKACTICRQQKLKCDASSKSYSQPCSRCARHRTECVVSRPFRRVKRLTKSELEAELDVLRQQVQGPSTNTLSQPGSSEDSSLISTENIAHSNRSRRSGHLGFDITQEHDGQFNGSEERVDIDFQGSNILESTPNFPQSVDPQLTKPQNLQDLQVGADEINDCFEMFLENYLRHVPAVENDIEPNSCYDNSPFLFWTIVAIGSRRYSKNPTLVVQLGPRVTELAKEALFTREGIIFNIQALILLCAWPTHLETLGNDITPVLAGTMLQLSMIVGLHVYGVGQDFSRTKFKMDPIQRDHRTRLWALSLTIFQRGHLLSGTPELHVPDMYDHDSMQDYLLLVLPSSVYFQRRVTKLVVEIVMNIERQALRKDPAARNAALGPMVGQGFIDLMELQTSCPGDIDRFYLLGSSLSILCLRFLLPSSMINFTDLETMYDVACSLIELVSSLDQTENFAFYGPVFVSKYLQLAACTVLKIVRSEVRGSLNVARGQKSYFSVIQLHKVLSIRSDDLRKVDNHSDTTLDQQEGISLCRWCNASLSCSLPQPLWSERLFDCYWWWRQEFAGQPNPYPSVECEKVDESTVPCHTPSSTRASDPASSTIAGWAPPIEISEPQWLLTDDLAVIDWSHLQGEADAQLHQITKLTPGWI